MSAVEVILVLVGGFLAGVINAMAGGGSLITVPLLSLAGLGGTVANGTNRVAVLVQNLGSAWGYTRKGAGNRRQVIRVLIPVVAGSVIGSVAASQIDDQLFERLFGALMLPLLALTIWRPKTAVAARPWPLWLTALTFFGIGVYGGAVQAGVGLILIMVLSRAGIHQADEGDGHDPLVTANAVKTIVILAVTVIAVPVFVLNGQVRWLPALVLSIGTGLGGYAGANVAVEGGERVIRPVLVAVVLVLASRMLGLWSVIADVFD
jgi:uncharacterized membrane protein YfcA